MPWVRRASSWRVRYPDSIPAYRDDRVIFQRQAMLFDHLGDQLDALLGADIGQSDKPRMRHVVEIDQFAKVSVDRNQDAFFRPSPFEQDPVARIGAEGTSFEHVVVMLAQPVRQASAGASVNEESHYSATETVASESRAITACA